PELFGSGEISEGEGGMTSWTTAEPLEPGLWYWRVWVSDGIEQTEPRYGQFVVESAMPDAGPSLNADAGTIPAPDGGLPPPSSGGCGCSVGARGPAALPLALGLGLFAWVARRRRRR
ncbi:MAG TPA: MYXO-CTERM sorting domain-containing protein, partial [Sandaracinaceae bacterium]